MFCLCVCSVRLFATPRTVARQAPLSFRFSRKEYWSELPFPPPGKIPNLGIKPASLESPEGFFTTTLKQCKSDVNTCKSMAGEGNGTPLQYSCLENPMDGGAW